MDNHSSASSHSRIADDILPQLQVFLNENENKRKAVVEEAGKTVSDRFEKLQELREKVRIEHEKQRLLLGVLEKLKIEEEDDENENGENEFMSRQIQILSQLLAVKKEEKVLKHAILNEKNNQIGQLEEKILAYQDVK